MSERHDSKSSDSVKTISLELYKKHLERAKSSHSFFTFCRLHYKVMTRLDSVFFQDILNLLTSPDVIKKEIDGEIWFMATSEFLLNSKSEWTEDEQKGHLSSLSKKGFLKTAKMGMPARRWICIDIAAVEKAIDDWEELVSEKSPDKLEEDSPDKTEEKSSDKTGEISPVNNIKKNNGKITTVDCHESSADPRSARPASGHRNSENFSKPSPKQSSGESEKETISYEKSKKQSNRQGDPQSGRSAPLPRKEPDPVKELTTWFHSELKKKRLDSPTTKSLKGWVVLFVALTQKIQERDNLNPEGAISYIKSILIDHLAHSHDEWQPQAWCAKKVCDKWECIERQWKSRQNGNGQKPKKDKYFNKHTGRWFEKLHDQYEHPTNSEWTIQLWSTGRWEVFYYKNERHESCNLRTKVSGGDANDGNFPPGF